MNPIFLYRSPTSRRELPPWLEPAVLPMIEVDSLDALTGPIGAEPCLTLLLPAREFTQVSSWLSDLSGRRAGLMRGALVVWGDVADCEEALAAGADLALFGAMPDLDKAQLSAVHRAQQQAPCVALQDVDCAASAGMRDLLAAAGCRLVDSAQEGEADLILLLRDAFSLSLLQTVAAQRARLAPAASLAVVLLRSPEWAEDQLRAAGADLVHVLPCEIPDQCADIPHVLERRILRRLWRWWERHMAQTGRGAAETALAMRGRLRRSDFLKLLDQHLQSADTARTALLSLRLDRWSELAQLGFAQAFELERQLGDRIALELEPADAWTPWLEFGLGILIERESPQAMLQAAERVRSAVAQASFELAGRPIESTASVGIALAPVGNAAKDPDRWFAAAHAAQSIANRLGGNRVDGVMDSRKRTMPDERVLIIREWVKEAGHGRQLQVEFQPVICLQQQAQRGLYSLRVKLRDPRAPLQGVQREEFLDLAREIRALGMIDRVGLFQALEALSEAAERGQPVGILAPLDLASFDRRQQLWLEGEFKRRGATARGLHVEVDAGLLIERPALLGVIHFLRRCGAGICVNDSSGSLLRLMQLPAVGLEFLRLPASALTILERPALAAVLEPWTRTGCGLIVDGVERIEQLSRLREMGVDLVMGEAVAAASLRPDFEFSREIA